MFNVLMTYVRPNTSVPYFSASGPNGEQMVSRLQITQDIQDNFITRSVVHSLDDLTMLVVISWESQAADTAWKAAYPDVLSRFIAADKAYAQANGITISYATETK